MTVLQIGVERSGNSWLYRLIEAMFQRAGVERRSFIVDQPMYEEAADWHLSFEGQRQIDTVRVRPDGVDYGIAGIRWEPIEDLEEYVSSCNHVWTHSGWCSLTPEVLSRFDRKVYIVRDPRDVAISKANFAFSEYSLRHLNPDPGDSPEGLLENRFFGNLIRWVRHVGRYLKAKESANIHFVTYEGLLHNFRGEAHELAQYLCLDLSNAELGAVEEQVAFSRLKREGSDHLRKGRSYQWKDRLSTKQQDVALRLAGDLMEILSYPVAREEDCLPEIPETVDQDRVERAIKSRRGNWLDKMRFAWSLLRSSRSWGEKIRKGIGFLMRRV